MQIGNIKIKTVFTLFLLCARMDLTDPRLISASEQ